MTIVLSYMRLILFIGGVLVGVQLPGFVDQYGKRLEAHFIESTKSIHQFQIDARKYFGGDMEKLIVYYKDNGDPVFHDGGKSIESIYRRHLVLKSSLSNFKKGSLSAYIQAFFKPVSDIQEEVRSNFSYSVKLDIGAIFFGLISGFALALFSEIIARTLIVAAVLLNKRLQPTP